MSRDQQSILPRRHPACQNVKFTCPGTEGNLPPWSYSCTARIASGNGGVLDTNSRTPITAWNIWSSGKSGKFHQRSLGSYQQGNTSTTSSFDNSALPASNVVLPTNYYLCQCPASFDNNDGISPNVYYTGFDTMGNDCSLNRISSVKQFKSSKGKGHRSLRSKSSKSYDKSDSGNQLDCKSLFDASGSVDITLGGPFQFFDPTCTNTDSSPTSPPLSKPTQKFDITPTSQITAKPANEPIPMANEIASTTFPTTIQTDAPSSQPILQPIATLTPPPIPLATPPTALESTPLPTMQLTPAPVLPMTPQPSTPLQSDQPPSTTAPITPPAASSPSQSPNAIPASPTVTPGTMVVPTTSIPVIINPVATPILAPSEAPVSQIEAPETIAPLTTAPITPPEASSPSQSQNAIPASPTVTNAFVGSIFT